MARTTLDFEYNGKDYSLGYTVDVLRRLDRNGVLARLTDRPLTMTEDLFMAAFEANHSDTSNRIRNEIFKEFAETTEDGSLLECLLEMIEEAREAMKPKGNLKWRMNRG